MQSWRWPGLCPARVQICKRNKDEERGQRWLQGIAKLADSELYRPAAWLLRLRRKMKAAGDES